MSDTVESSGQHFVIGLRPGVDLDPRDTRLLSDIRPAGVVVFRDNFLAGAPYDVWHTRFSRLVAGVRSAIGRDDVVIGIDHEGGTVLRPPEPITPFGFARSWADNAESVGRAMGIELASLGVNVDFAPVADIDSNPSNPVIGQRAFSSGAEDVARACVAFCDGLSAAGVLPCAKHFPGHGDSAADSHYELPIVAATMGEMEARELVPFAQLVKNDIPMIMTAHVLYPDVDPVEPATSSSTWVTDVLRRGMGFAGVVVTDDMGMRAVAAKLATRGACAQILNSGTDLIMVCSHWTDTERVREMAADLAQAQLSGLLDTVMLQRSAARIQRLRRQLRVNTPRLLPMDALSAHRAVAPMRARRGHAGQTVSLDEEA